MRRLGTAWRSGANPRSTVVALAAGALFVFLPLSPAAGQVSSAGAATDGRIVFVLGKSAGNCHGSAGDLATANPDGTQCRVLTTTRDAASPALNPAGDTIAFTRGQPPATAIYIIGVDGSGERKLISGPASEPAWSPDGTQIAFVGQQAGTSQIELADALTGAIKAQLTTGPAANSQPAWSPDGTEIAFIADQTGSSRLSVMQADGAGQQPLTADAGADADPAWSPDGQRIAFASDQLGTGTFQIYQVGRDGIGETRVSRDKLSDRNPTWAPDGQLLAFTSVSGNGAGAVALARPPGVSASGKLPRFPGAQPVWAALPLPSTPVPGVTINAIPNGAVQVQPGGSSLAVSLNGSVSVPVTAEAPTIFRIAPRASVTLQTRLNGNRSSDVTIGGSAVAVSQPAGQSTQIKLVGGVSNPCPASVARAARPIDLKRWSVNNHGDAHPRVVRGYLNLVLKGTFVVIEDICRLPSGHQHFMVVFKRGDGAVNGKNVTPVSRSGTPCRSSSAVVRGTNDVLSTRTLQILRAAAHGRFCTQGRYAAATVTG